MNWSSVRHWSRRWTRETWTGSASPRRPSTSSPSSSWRKREPRPRSGTIWTNCSISCAAPTPTGDSSGRCSTTSSPCSRKASRPRAGGAAPTCTGTPFPARCAPAGAPGWRPSRAAERSRRRRNIRWSPNPRTGSLANSTRTSPSRATGATSSCSGPPPGGSGGSPKDRSGSRTPRAQRRRFPSGGEKRRGGPPN